MLQFNCRFGDCMVGVANGLAPWAAPQSWLRQVRPCARPCVPVSAAPLIR
jgi:hypothetical protein